MYSYHSLSKMMEDFLDIWKELFSFAFGKGRNDIIFSLFRLHMEMEVAGDDKMTTEAERDQHSSREVEEAEVVIDGEEEREKGVETGEAREEITIDL